MTGTSKRMRRPTPEPPALSINVRVASTPTTTPCGNFRLMRKIARGSEGDIWAAEPRGGGHSQAVKIIESCHSRRVKTRETFIRSLDHPNILQIRDVQYDDEACRCFLLMDLCDCDLFDLIKCTLWALLRRFWMFLPQTDCIRVGILPQTPRIPLRYEA